MDELRLTVFYWYQSIWSMSDFNLLNGDLTTHTILIRLKVKRERWGGVSSVLKGAFKVNKET